MGSTDIRIQPLAVWSKKSNGAVRTVGEVDDFDGPTAFVDLAVVESAQKKSVYKVGLATLHPRQDVVGVGEARREVTAGKSTAQVARSQC